MKDNMIDNELQELLNAVTEHGRNQRRQQKLLAKIDELAAAEESPKRSRRTFWWAATTGIAASLLLILTIRPKEQPLVANNREAERVQDTILTTDSTIVKESGKQLLHSPIQTVSSSNNSHLAKLDLSNEPEMQEEHQEVLATATESTENMTVELPYAEDLLADNSADSQQDDMQSAAEQPQMVTIRATLGTESQNSESLRIKNETFAFNLALGPKEEEDMSQNPKFKPLIVNNL